MSVVHVSVGAGREEERKMTAVTSTQPRAGDRMTLDEWAARPEDDELRIELVEGVIVMPPTPLSEGHQAAVMGLAFLLKQRCPRTMKVLPGPLGVLVPTRNSALEPDLVLLPAANPDDANRLPSLVVELASPSTRGRDQVDKRRLYAARGIPSYWLLDPAIPDLRVLELGDSGEYVEVAYVVGDQAVELVHPFAVRLCPGELS